MYYVAICEVKLLGSTFLHINMQVILHAHILSEVAVAGCSLQSMLTMPGPAAHRLPKILESVVVALVSKVCHWIL